MVFLFFRLFKDYPLSEDIGLSSSEIIEHVIDEIKDTIVFDVEFYETCIFETEQLRKRQKAVEKAKNMIQRGKLPLSKKFEDWLIPNDYALEDYEEYLLLCLKKNFLSRKKNDKTLLQKLEKLKIRKNYNENKNKRSRIS